MHCLGSVKKKFGTKVGQMDIIIGENVCCKYEMVNVLFHGGFKFENTWIIVL